MKDVGPGEPVAFGEITLTPLEEKGIHCQTGNGSVSFYAYKRPLGILIVTSRGKLAFDISGRELTVNE
jgi:hypothetical protein